MLRDVYRYEFEPSVPFDQVEAALLLAILGTESLHGESQARLDAVHCSSAERRTCVIEAGSDVGRDLNRLFIGYVRQEFGESTFTVRRVQDEVAETQA